MQKKKIFNGCDKRIKINRLQFLKCGALFLNIVFYNKTYVLLFVIYKSQFILFLIDMLSYKIYIPDQYKLPFFNKYKSHKTRFSVVKQSLQPCYARKNMKICFISYDTKKTKILFQKFSFIAIKLKLDISLITIIFNILNMYSHKTRFSEKSENLFHFP